MVQFSILPLIINVLIVFIIMRKKIISVTHWGPKMGKMSVLVLAAIATVMTLSMHDKVLAVGSSGERRTRISTYCHCAITSIRHIYSRYIHNNSKWIYRPSKPIHV